MTDSQIVREVLDGNGRAFTELIRRYQNLVYGLAYDQLHHFDDARDAAQEAFIQAYLQLRSLREPSRFGAWLRQLTVNECRTWRRTRRARPAESLTGLQEDRAASSDSCQDTERRLLVAQALECLSEPVRQTVVLFYFQSFSLQEIAAFLEVPTSTVMSRLRNARARLRKEWIAMTQETIDQHRLPDDFATRVPIPYDEYDLTTHPTRLAEPLSSFREQLVLSAFPPGAQITDARLGGYDWQTSDVTKPVGVTVRMADGSEQTVQVKMSSLIGGIDREAALLPVLQRLGLPVPALLAGPATDPAYPHAGPVIVTSLLPGKDILDLCWEAAPKELERGTDLLLRAVSRLRELTAPMEAEEAARDLPRNTLEAELQGVIARGGPWMQTPTFADAVKKLQPVVAAERTPLVFSNGCYSPHMFLVDGPLDSANPEVAGYADFTGACFEDPHIGFAKFWTYDWYPLNRVGLVERYLYRHNLTRREFAPRVAIRCLATLQRELPVRGHDAEIGEYREALLGLLGQAMSDLAWL